MCSIVHEMDNDFKAKAIFMGIKVGLLSGIDLLSLICKMIDTQWMYELMVAELLGTYFDTIIAQLILIIANLDRMTCFILYLKAHRYSVTFWCITVLTFQRL